MAVGKYRLKKTIYHDGGICVGLAKDYMAQGQNLVTILQKDKEGNLKYPGTYEVSSNIITQYPLKAFGKMPPQYFVPFEALKKVRVEQLGF